VEAKSQPAFLTPDGGITVGFFPGCDEIFEPQRP
jgi:hypothetical protein